LVEFEILDPSKICKNGATFVRIGTDIFGKKSLKLVIRKISDIFFD